VKGQLSSRSSTSGFNPYNDVFFTSKAFLATHKAELEKFHRGQHAGSGRTICGNITARHDGQRRAAEAPNNQQYQ